MTAAEPASVPEGAAYAGAVDHYTSPDRRDWVKRVWEEPELVRLLEIGAQAGLGVAHSLTATVVTRPGG